VTKLIAVLVAVLALAPAASAAEFIDVAAVHQPRHVASPPGDTARTFILDTRGVVRVVERGELLERPFLDISADVRSDPDSLYGLLSIAFAPDYEQSRRFYVFYSDRENNTRVVEFRRSRNDPNVAKPSSRRDVLTLDLPGPYNSGQPHLGGQIAFGPDGFLYVATGDGSRGYVDEEIVENAQKHRSLLGKLLRIDPVAKHGSYRVPRGNPFVGRRGRDEIYAYGLRNPWRFSFDRGRIAIADAGEADREEIDILPLEKARGANFGWPMFEGSLRQRAGARRPGITFPVFEYKHRNHTPLEEYAGGECGGAVVGGYFARDRRVPSLYGRYVYADFCFAQVRSFRLRDPYGTDRLEFESLSSRGLVPTSFGLDAKKHLYAAFGAFGDGADVLRATEGSDSN
jgi:glucose/arabinose dehydrogenase